MGIDHKVGEETQFITFEGKWEQPILNAVFQD